MTKQFLNPPPIRYFKNTGSRIAGVILIPLLAVFLVLQLPAVQTAIGKRLLASLNGKIDGRIELSSLRIGFFNTLTVKDIAVIDSHPATLDPDGNPVIPADTLFRAKSIKASFSLASILAKKGMHIRRAEVNGGYLHIVNEHEGFRANNIQRILRSKKQDGKFKPGPHLFDVGKVRVRDFRFRLTHHVRRCKLQKKGKADVKGIDFSDLDLTADIKGHGLRYTGGRMSGTCEDLSLKEKSGYSIRHLSAKASSGMGISIIENIRLIDPWSNIDIPLMTMEYPFSKAFAYFNELVKMEINIAGTGLSTISAGYFMPKLYGSRLNLDITKGKVSGFVNDISVDELKFTERGSRVAGDLSLSFKKAKGVEKARLETAVRVLSFDMKGLDDFTGRSKFIRQGKLGALAPGIRFRFRGSGGGRFDRLALKGELDSDAGHAGTSVRIYNLGEKGSHIEVDGTIGTKDLNIGRIINKKDIGECTVSSGFHTTLGKGEKSVRIDSLRLARLRFKGYDYSNISAAGTYGSNAFDGKLMCADPNLSLLFQGVFNLSKKTDNKLYKFYANVGYADLRALHLDNRGGKSIVSCQIHANYMLLGRNKMKDMIGDIDLRNVILENDSGRKALGNIKLASHSNDDINRIQFNSSFLDGDFVGNRPVTSFPGDLVRLTAGKVLPALFSGEIKPETGSEYEVNLNFHDSRDLLSFVRPGLYIADSTAVKLTVNSQGAVKGSVKSPRLAVGKEHLKGIDMSFDNADDSLRLFSSSQAVRFRTLGYNRTTLKMTAVADSLAMSVSYDQGLRYEDKGTLSMGARFSRDVADSLVVQARTLPSSFKFGGDTWNLSDTRFRYSRGTLDIKGLDIRCGEQFLAMEGAVSRTGTDTLSLKLNRIGIAFADLLMKNPVGTEGEISGDAILVSPLNRTMKANLDMHGRSIAIGGEKAGDIALTGKWNSADNALEFHFENILDGRKAIEAVASMREGMKEVSMEASMNSMNLILGAPFVKSVFSELGGFLNGKVIIKRTKGSPMQINTSGASFDNARLALAGTGVTYVLNGPLHMGNNEIGLDDVSIKDEKGGEGKLDGKVQFDADGRPKFNVKATIDKLSILNIKEKPGDNTLFGELALSGSLNISGPADAPVVEAVLANAGKGSLHVPVGKGNAIKSDSLLTFTGRQMSSYVDPYEAMVNTIRVKTVKTKADVQAHIRLTTTPELQAFLDIDRASGNSLKAMGNGLITVDWRPRLSKLVLGGQYELTGGNYHFEIPGIVKKEFAIKNGSTVTFGGDLAESTLDIDAVYSLKTSLASLVGDKSSVSSRRLVEAGLNISGKLKNPNLNFSIDIPDLSPTVKTTVDSNLNTEDKVQKQFVALLIMGTFLPSDQAGVVNSTNILYSNVGEVVSNQINNIFQRLDIPLDLGLGYQQNRYGTNLFDVAVSTQLFNDRVVVNGSVGNRQYSTSTNPNGDVVGDVDLEIKLDRPGLIRLKLFSHSADEMTSYLDHSQRNGLGISYQNEFSRFRDFFRTSFTTKKRREEIKKEIDAAEQEKETIRITK